MADKKVFRLSRLADAFPALMSRRKSLAHLVIELKNSAGFQAGAVIHTKKHGSGFQYYKRENGSEIYIPASEKDSLRPLLQAEYDQKALAAAEKEIRMIDKYMAFVSAEGTEHVYRGMAEGKRPLITPVILTDEECLAKWNAMQFIPKVFEPGSREQRSMKGEYVTSKSEELIANALYVQGIPYHYEKPLSLDQNLTVYPDFTIFDVKTRKVFYWEHLGLMDKESYAIKAVRKLRSYAAAGIWPGDRLILTFETASQPLNSAYVQNTIDKYLRV